MKQAVLVCGDDAFLVERKTREILAQFNPAGDASLTRERLDLSSADAEQTRLTVKSAVEALQTPDFFAQGKIVWLKDAASLLAPRKAQPQAVVAAAETLAQWIESGAAAPDVVLLVSAKGVNRTSVLFRAFRTFATVHDFPVGDRPQDRLRHAQERLAEFLSAFGIRMTPDVRRAFLDRVGHETCRLYAELAKLDAYLGERREATTDDLLDIISLGSVDAAWDLTDAVGLRQPDAMFRALRRLFLQRQNAIGLAGMVENRVRELLVYRQALDQNWLKIDRGNARWGAPPPAVERALSGRGFDPRATHPYRAGRLAEQARHYSLRELRHARYRLMILRERMVTTGIDAELLLEMTLLRILGGGRSRGTVRPAPRGRA